MIYPALCFFMFFLIVTFTMFFFLYKQKVYENNIKIIYEKNHLAVYFYESNNRRILEENLAKNQLPLYWHFNIEDGQIKCIKSTMHYGESIIAIPQIEFDELRRQDLLIIDQTIFQ